MSIQWLIRHPDNADESPGLIVIDEAHHVLAESYQALWRRYREAYKLGMTATPCRLNRKGFTELFDVLVTSWSIAEFITKGRLSLFDYVSIPSGSMEQQLINSLKKRGADGDFQVKEMNELLNKRPSIERLYSSVERYANGKKGIVYAISIDHARRIAEYYNEKGINTTAIDSKTPATERKAKVDLFREGIIRILVNVDVFSEGFDCPDVEFIQMARPTLSLSKYLQQAGRGLRITEGKESCILIDNVGLYRIFGLPTVEWNWKAMFEGRMNGKGLPTVRQKGISNQTNASAGEDISDRGNMETIISHECLLEILENQKEQSPKQAEKTIVLKAWQSKQSGLWGLKNGQEQTTEACFTKIFDIRYNLAAAKFKNGSYGLVEPTGKELWNTNKCKSMKFTSNQMLAIISPDNKKRYMDLHSLRIYEKKPEIKRYGNIELLKTGQTCHSRTKNIYTYRLSMNNDYIYKENFYLAIFDNKMPQSAHADTAVQYGYSNYACLLSDDYDDFYWICQWLPDGSIIVMNNQRQYFHARQGERKSTSDATCRKRKMPTADKKSTDLSNKQKHTALQNKQSKKPKETKY